MGGACSTARGVTAQEEAAAAAAALASCQAAAGVPPDRQIRNSAFRNTRRGSVSAEPSGGAGAEAGAETNSQPLEPKSEEDLDRVLALVRNSIVLRGLGEGEQAAVAAAMRRRPVAPGEAVIREGEEGDALYEIEEGTFVASRGGEAVCEYRGQGSFGELALMYNCPRAATVTAGPAGGLLWSLDRGAFREVVVGGQARRRVAREATLRGCAALRALTPCQLAAVADCLVEEKFQAGEPILREGEEVGPEAKFYILEGGSVQCFRAVNGERRLVRAFVPGEVFGEVALLTNAPRRADCVAAGEVTCLTLSREAFGRLMGSAVGALQRQADEYSLLNDSLAGEEPPAAPAPAAAQPAAGSRPGTPAARPGTGQRSRPAGRGGSG